MTNLGIQVLMHEPYTGNMSCIHDSHQHGADLCTGHMLRRNLCADEDTPHPIAGVAVVVPCAPATQTFLLKILCTMHAVPKWKHLVSDSSHPFMVQAD